MRISSEAVLFLKLTVRSISFSFPVQLICYVLYMIYITCQLPFRKAKTTPRGVVFAKIIFLLFHLLTRSNLYPGKVHVDKCTTWLHYYWNIDFRSIWLASRPVESEAVPIGNIPRPASASRALLRLSPCYRTYLRPTIKWDFGYSRLPWLDGRWVQDSRTYSPRRCWFGITSDSNFK